WLNQAIQSGYHSSVSIPTRLDTDTGPVEPPPAEVVDDIPPETPAPPELPPPEVPDEVIEVARTSESARKGLGTKRALYHRVARPRALLSAWDEVGKYINQPGRRLTRPAEARSLIKELTTIRRLLKNFPPLLGEAGQPGYLVISLARQQVIVPTFQ